MRIKEQCIRMLWVICLLAMGPTIVLSENGSDHTFTFTSIEKISNAKLAISVTGTVTDAEGEPLIGVNVQVKGTTVGTSTDFDGHYALDNVDEDAVLVFSYVGYQTREVDVEGRTVLDVVMESDAQLIDELVVVGYGTQRKSDLTGSVATVDIADLELAPVGSFDEALAPYNDPRRETWVVSKPISTDEVNLGPDWSNGIRGIRDQKLVEFTYSYSNPGNYTAVFVGKNVTIDDEKESVQKIPITITP